MKKEIILYSAAGALTTGLNYLVFAVLAQGLHIHYMAANTAAWCTAVVFAYIVNRKYVFCSTNSWKREAVLFLMSRAATLLLENAALYLMITILGLDEFWAKGIGCAAVIAGNYILCKKKYLQGGTNETNQYCYPLSE
jgi:putative flippase GtrA